MTGQSFTTSVDIANRVCQHVGVRRILTLTDTVKQAKEINACYDRIRQAELTRNLWRFATRRALLRPIGTALQAWNSALTYANGAYVTFGTDVNGNPINYVSLQGANTNQEPDTSPTFWSLFFGPSTLEITFGNYNNATNYSRGMIVNGSDSRLYIYIGGAATTGNDPTLTTGFWERYYGPTQAVQYDSTQSYQIGDLVFYTTTTNVYFSLINLNAADPTVTPNGWVQQTCTVTPVGLVWPAGTGPATDPNTKNIYILPDGYLRRAVTDPSAGRQSFLGFPSNMPAADWVFEGRYLLSMDPGPVMLRFIADVVDVRQMGALFCEALACSIALEVCEPITQSTTKLKDIGAMYKKHMFDASDTNAVEQGSTMPPLDDYILCRF